jgi:hypothetical protein
VSRKTIISDACVELSLPQPDPNTLEVDDQVALLRRLVTAEGRALSKRYSWQALVRQQTFLTVATPQQDAPNIDWLANQSIAQDFDRIVPETVYDRTLRKYAYGPVSPDEWAQIGGTMITLVNPSWRIMGNRMWITPTPPAGNLWAYEYISKFWAYGAPGSAKDRMDADDDRTFLDEEAITLGVVYRFRADKGHEFGDDLKEYERRVADLIVNDGARPRLVAGTISAARVPRPPQAPETIVFP